MTFTPSRTAIEGPCGLVMTRSALNSPCARIASSSAAICSLTLANPLPGSLRASGLSPVGPAQHDLAALGAPDRGERLLEVPGVEPVRDHRGDIQPGLDQYRHPVPGLEHLAP